MCGVAAVVDRRYEQNVIPVAVDLAHEVKHRGGLAAGISYLLKTGEAPIWVYKNLGQAHKVLTQEDFRDVASPVAMIHTRYATNKSNVAELAQPFLYAPRTRPQELDRHFSFGFNGNIPFTDDVVARLKAEGFSPQYPVDTDVIGTLIQQSLEIRNDMRSAIQRVGNELDGAFNLTVMNGVGDVFAARDPHGFHPLVYAQHGSLMMVASEDTAIRNAMKNDQMPIQTIAPGQLLSVRSGNVYLEQLWQPQRAHCFFEWIYFAKTWSNIEGKLNRDSRREAGRILAQMDPDLVADMVACIPESAIAAAEGYAEEKQWNFDEEAITKRPDTPRTFISDEGRAQKAYEKYEIDTQRMRDKIVVIVDDSVVRATTMDVVIKRIKEEAGPREIHLRLACPPILSPCFYGIDMSTIRELRVRQFRGQTLSYEDNLLLDEELQKLAVNIGVTSIKFLPLQALPAITGKDFSDLCTACITGKYPTAHGAQLANDQEQGLIQIS